jgi:hypothetical protein
VGEGYCEAPYQAHENWVQETPTGQKYLRYDEKGPPLASSRAPLAKRVEVDHNPIEQEKEMRQCSRKTTEDLQKSLSKKATQVRSFLKDIRTKERISHTIPVTLPHPWSAPRQVDL